MPSRAVLAIVAVSSSVATARHVAAQSAVPVRGLAYDSLQAAPLVGAVITIAGTSLSARTDDRGRFRFDAVAPGTHTFAAQHAALDSIGFSGISSRARVTDGAAEVRIAVPSFATLWRAACGASRPPKDSGFVYGSVRSVADQAPVPNADVDLTWLDVRVTREKRVSEARWRGHSRTDSTGSYGVCGVPTNVGLRVSAATDSAASGLVDLLGIGRRVQRRDLLIAPVMDSSSSTRGTITGLVTDSTGVPIVDARVIADGVPEVRTGTNGRFAARNVPLGTRQVEVLAIGMVPQTSVVDVFPRDTVTILASMRRVNTLDVIRVTGRPEVLRVMSEFEERRRRGFGHARDSTDIVTRGSMSAVFFDIPGVRVEFLTASQFALSLPSGRGGRCLANVVIDGIRSDFEHLNFYRPPEIAAIEVYPQRFSVPERFVTSSDCGAVIVWTKWAFGE
jgi:hypothetical protein